MSKSFELNIRGYFRDEVRTQFPHLQGVYFIYRGTLNNVTRTCTLKVLIYVGETNDIYNCLNEHTNRARFTEDLKDGETLFYTYALTEFSESERRRVVASLIYELAPYRNERRSRNFEYSQTTIKINGDRHAFIPDVIKAPSY